MCTTPSTRRIRTPRWSNGTSPLIRHVHVQELDGRHCGWGDYDYKPVLDMLRRLDYKGWVSLEAFDFTPGAEKLANESLRHLEAEIAKLPS